jgi:MFS family permease
LLIASFYDTELTPYQTLVQTSVPDYIRGKILSFFALIFSSTQIIGMAAIGILAEFVGIRQTLFLSGFIITIPVVLMFLILFLLNLEDEVKERKTMLLELYKITNN